jgi:hypothetical protein
MLPLVGPERPGRGGSMTESERDQGAQANTAVEQAASLLAMAEEPSTFVVVLAGGEQDG